MTVRVSEAEARALATAREQEGRVRVWRRYRAIELLAAGQAPEAVAEALGCSRASVYNWASAWQAAGLSGLAEGPHAGRPRRLGAAATAQVDALLASDPQAAGSQSTDWTVPLLQTELAARGHAVSQRTVRRTVRRAGWRWKRPAYVLGRPDPAYAEKKRQ